MPFDREPKPISYKEYKKNRKLKEFFGGENETDAANGLEF